MSTPMPMSSRHILPNPLPFQSVTSFVNDPQMTNYVLGGGVEATKQT